MIVKKQIIPGLWNYNTKEVIKVEVRDNVFIITLFLCFR